MHRADGQARGDLLISDTGATGFQRLALGTQGNVLKAGANDPAWGVDPASDLITTAGDILYGSAADTLARLGLGSTGFVLKAGASAPEWAVDPVADLVTTAGDTLYATAADTLARLALGTAGHVLKAGASAPEWAVDPVADLVTTAGDTLYATAADTLARLALGTSGFVLKAGASAPEWAVDPTADLVTTAGDIVYGTAADTLARLGIGTAGQVLTVNSGAVAPEWAAASGGLTLAGSNTTEATTASTGATDLLTVGSLSIAATSPILIVGNARKTSGAGAAVGLGLKLNTTVVGEASTNSALVGLWLSTTTNEAESGLFVAFIGPRVTNYLRAAAGFYHARGASAATSGTSRPTITADMPTATITDVAIRAISGSASVTVGVDEVFVYTLGT